MILLFLFHFLFPPLDTPGRSYDSREGRPLHTYGQVGDRFVHLLSCAVRSYFLQAKEICFIPNINATERAFACDFLQFTRMHKIVKCVRLLCHNLVKCLKNNLPRNFILWGIFVRLVKNMHPVSSQLCKASREGRMCVKARIS